MRILHTVDSYLPAHHGMSEVVRQISERLVEKGHEVVIATSSDPNRQNKSIKGVRIEEFDVSGNWVMGVKKEVARYCQFLLNSNFDIVTNFAAQQWATDVILPILNKVRGKKVLVPTGFSALHVPVYQEYFCLMKNWLRNYDCVVYSSNQYQDFKFAEQHNIDNGVLIPNGAAADEFLEETGIDIREILEIPSGSLLVLHVAGYVGGKGHYDAIRIFSKSKVKNATLLFICPEFKSGTPTSRIETITTLEDVYKLITRGRKIDDNLLLRLRFVFNFVNRLNNRQVIFRALTRSEVVAAYRAADLFLFPSRIECSPIVLFEAMASNTPFLSTDVGNAREIVGWGDSGIILPTQFVNYSGFAKINQSAKIFSQLAEDTDRRQKMAESGFKAWLDEFTWEKIAGEYEALYETLIMQ